MSLSSLSFIITLSVTLFIENGVAKNFCKDEVKSNVVKYSAIFQPKYQDSVQSYANCMADYLQDKNGNSREECFEGFLNAEAQMHCMKNWANFKVEREFKTAVGYVHNLRTKQFHEIKINSTKFSVSDVPEFSTRNLIVTSSRIQFSKKSLTQ